MSSFTIPCHGKREFSVLEGQDSDLKLEIEITPDEKMPQKYSVCFKFSKPLHISAKSSEELVLEPPVLESPEDVKEGPARKRPKIALQGDIPTKKQKKAVASKATAGKKGGSKYVRLLEQFANEKRGAWKKEHFSDQNVAAYIKEFLREPRKKTHRQSFMKAITEATKKLDLPPLSNQSDWPLSHALFDDAYTGGDENVDDEEIMDETIFSKPRPTAELKTKVFIRCLHVIGHLNSMDIHCMRVDSSEIRDGQDGARCFVSKIRLNHVVLPCKCEKICSDSSCPFAIARDYMDLIRASGCKGPLFHEWGENNPDLLIKTKLTLSTIEKLTGGGFVPCFPMSTKVTVVD